ncbi:LysR family transcriptional regulator [Lysinibacillus sphaericus]|uniref:LysR family transcriptional regulator n=1 Tax=Lysinibacillus sphaericus TaxID=1421 RepID=A0A2S0K1Z7_LYSSH|nr:LysR family transcriptional regulator [Lysinibacillus sphaericus]AVK97366.1 LysR family transcriptional regulator [Lysinibacillus sphaericus]MCS1382298.1 LysR family transcriptional regulator [Lysinibacillus sphaericus]MED4542675.1 LysR family transcriptional regulator [Lysinibacillus sphaericus]TKI19947.1 LysR family transcriptional regulator [Lysinibacillus sphaericus]UDK96468.1 LysR family transcriptional regulator [Lysinibacillus sphaericus]
MSLVKYEILNKVAEVSSFTKAADALGLTQSAVSHAVSSLEKECGFALIHRSRTGVTLTSEGQTMLRAMRQVLDANELLQQEAAHILGVTRGKLRIGVISSISSNWMPEIIRIMDNQFPGIQVELREGDYYEIEQWLQSGVVDAGFLNGQKSEQFQFIQLVQDPLLCIVSNQSSLYNRAEIDIAELEDMPFIMTSYRGTNDVKVLLEQYHVKPNIRFELSEEVGIISMISHHLGISILPRLVINRLPSSLKAIPLKQGGYRTIGLAMKHQASPVTKKFAEILSAWLKEQNKK